MIRRLALVLCVATALVPGLARAAHAANGGNAPTLGNVTLSAPIPSWAPQNPHTVLHSSPVVADLFGDAPNGAKDIVVASHDGWLYAYQWVQGVLQVLPGWPQNVGAHVGSSPAVADLDRDGQKEIIVGVGDATDLDNGHQGAGGIAVYEPDGQLRWFYKPAPFPQTGETQVFSTPAIGDVDHDGYPDIVAASYNRFVYAIDRNGHDLPGWPFEVVDTTWSSPSLVDLDHNGRLSVVIGSDFGTGGPPALGCPSSTGGLLLVLQADGSRRAGFPKCLDTPIWSSPAIVDLLGDGVPVAVFGTNNYIGGNHGGQDFIYAVRLTDGQAMPGWPVHLPHGPAEQAFSSPAVADLDGDGRVEVVIGSDWGRNADQGSLYVIGADGAIQWEKDFANPVLGSPIVGDLDGDGKPDVAVGVGDWNVYGYDRKGKANFTFHSESFIFNSPVLSDLNRDGLNEMVIASGFREDKPEMWVVATRGSAAPDANPWPMFRQNAARTGTGVKMAPVAPTSPGNHFDEYLLVNNPGEVPAHVTVSLELPAGPPIPVVVTVDPHARVTVPVDDYAANSAVSARIDSDQPVVAERSMYFSYGPSDWTGGHATHGASAPSTDWFLAEGYTADNFDTFVLVQNPGDVAANATVTLMKPGGGTATKVLHLGPQSRSTLVVKDVPGFSSTEVSFSVHSTQPVVVERSMYFDYGGRNGGHDAVGVTGLSTDWFLAEGYTANSFDTYVLVANPGDQTAHVTYTFLRPSGDPIVATKDIAPHSRGTLMVDSVPGLDATEVSTKVSADVPIAVERAMYFNYHGETGGHDAEGVTRLGSDWYLAEGNTNPGFDTYVLLANPGPVDAQVAVDYMRENGTVAHYTLVVTARSRQTIHLNEVVPNAGVATHVSVSNGVGIAVERSMYFTYGPGWDGGDDAQAVPAPSQQWFFAEGYTGP